MGRGKKNFGKTREYMWYEQGGKCYFCGKAMIWREFGPEDRMNHDDATIDHLDERGSINRGKNLTHYRRVLSCNQCNHKRGIDFYFNGHTYNQLSFYEEFNPKHTLFLIEPVE